MVFMICQIRPSVRSFVCPSLRLSVPSFVRSFFSFPLFVCSFVCTFLRLYFLWFVRSFFFFRSFLLLVYSFIHLFIYSFIDSKVTNEIYLFFGINHCYYLFRGELFCISIVFIYCYLGIHNNFVWRARGSPKFYIIAAPLNRLIDTIISL